MEGSVWLPVKADRFPLKRPQTHLPGRKTKSEVGQALCKLFLRPLPPFLRHFWTSGLAEMLTCVAAATAFDVHLKQRRCGEEEADPWTQRDQQRLRHPF